MTHQSNVNYTQDTDEVDLNESDLEVPHGQPGAQQLYDIERKRLFDQIEILNKQLDTMSSELDNMSSKRDQLTWRLQANESTLQLQKKEISDQIDLNEGFYDAINRAKAALAGEGEFGSLSVERRVEEAFCILDLATNALADRTKRPERPVDGKKLAKEACQWDSGELTPKDWKTGDAEGSEPIEVAREVTLLGQGVYDLTAGKLLSLVHDDGKLEIVAESDDLDMLLYCTNKAKPDLAPGHVITVLKVEDKIFVLEPSKWKIASRRSETKVEGC